ncbi:unnamed protein product [Rhizoctonia solani]|uniref:Uncharacterized protein n=1 Tax=Rhizoctonia solani TaxID=456999 RepID=A0A8H2X4N0_9AGAM|nr:unnamed protein product [Rhizoctonia solani]
MVQTICPANRTRGWVPPVHLGCSTAAFGYFQPMKVSQAKKRGKAPAAKKPGAKPRPKMRALRFGTNRGNTDKYIFCCTTRVAKQELIDKAEGAKEGAGSKTKPAPKSKEEGKAKK